jgi:hypothetical protein
MKIRGKKLVQEYLSFSEKVKPEELDDMKSILKKDLGSLLRGFNTIIITLRKENRPNFLLKLLGINLDNSRTFLDLQKISNLYETMSYSDALSESLGTFFVNEVEEGNLVGAPDAPMLRKEFIKFQKELRKRKKDYEELLDEDESYALDYSFGNVDDTNDMNAKQLQNRKEMLMLKEEDPEKFNILWVRGDYHLATIVARLENADYKETRLMREEILKRNKITVEVKDYGLTITEIIGGLQVARKANERYLYKAFSEGNINLLAMILVLKSAHLIEDEDKIAAQKTIQALCNDAGMYKIAQDQDRYVPIKRIIKKYALPAHRNWKKEEIS